MQYKCFLKCAVYALISNWMSLITPQSLFLLKPGTGAYNVPELTFHNLFLFEGGMESGLCHCMCLSFHCWTEKLFSITGLKEVTLVNMRDNITQMLRWLWCKLMICCIWLNLYTLLRVSSRLQLTLFTLNNGFIYKRKNIFCHARLIFLMPACCYCFIYVLFHSV